MTTLTLQSENNLSIRPMIEVAIGREIGRIRVAIRQTEASLRAFETQFGMATDEFIRRYAEDEIAETLETDEWIGESRLLDSLHARLDALNGIEIVG